jgi:transcriptional regulator of arginine metabolism
MPTKAQRQDRIARIIAEQTVWSQQELQERLARAGFAVTQATLSRDLTRLGVLKGPGGYVLPASPGAAAVSATEPAGSHGVAVGIDGDALLQRTLRRELRAVHAAGNLVIVRTDAGHANALAIEIDRARQPEVVGSIAGDDTIFLAARSGSAATRLVKRFKSLTSNN